MALSPVLHQDGPGEQADLAPAPAPIAAHAASGTIDGVSEPPIIPTDIEAIGFRTLSDTAPGEPAPGEPAPGEPAPGEPVASASGATFWLRSLLVVVSAYVVFCIGGWYTSLSTRPVPQGPFVTPPGTAAAGQVFVHIAGRVRHPGLYQLAYTARVNDAIHDAGGALPDADLDALNLAAWVEDGTRIEVPPKAKAMPYAAAPHQAAAAVKAPQRDVVPQRAAVIAGTSTSAPHRPPPEPRAAGNSAQQPGPAGAATGRPGKPTAEYLALHPVDINTAEVTELQQLPGVGPAMAAKIIAQRQDYGKFKTVDDLREVKGIGEKRLDKLRPLVTVK